MNPEKDKDIRRQVTSVPDKQEATHISHALEEFLDQGVEAIQPVVEETSKESKVARLSYLLQQASEGASVDQNELEALRKELQKGSNNPDE